MKRWRSFWFWDGRQAYNWFRVGHGLSLLIFLAFWWREAREWLTTEGFHFPGGVPLLPATWLVLFGVVQFGAVLGVISGRGTRPAAAVSWACLLYVTLADRLAAFSINGIYLYTLLVLALIPPTPRTSGAAVRMLQITLLVLYFSSGWNKAVFGEWLDHPDTLQRIMAGPSMTPFAAWALQIVPAWAWTGAQYATLAFELFAPILFFSKLRLPALVFGCLLHLLIAACMHQYIFFSLQVLSFYVLFLPFPRFAEVSAPLARAAGN